MALAREHEEGESKSDFKGRVRHKESIATKIGVYIYGQNPKDGNSRNRLMTKVRTARHGEKVQGKKRKSGFVG